MLTEADEQCFKTLPFGGISDLSYLCAGIHWK